MHSLWATQSCSNSSNWVQLSWIFLTWSHIFVTICMTRVIWKDIMVRLKGGASIYTFAYELNEMKLNEIQPCRLCSYEFVQVSHETHPLTLTLIWYFYMAGKLHVGTPVCVYRKWVLKASFSYNNGFRCFTKEFMSSSMAPWKPQFFTVLFKDLPHLTALSKPIIPLFSRSILNQNIK